MMGKKIHIFFLVFITKNKEMQFEKDGMKIISQELKPKISGGMTVESPGSLMSIPGKILGHIAQEMICEYLEKNTSH